MDNKEIEEQLREKVVDIVTDPPCRECEFWDKQGHYCFLKNMHKTSEKCRLADQFLPLFEQVRQRVFLEIENHKCTDGGIVIRTNYPETDWWKALKGGK